MRPSNALQSVYLCLEPVGFRLQINASSARIQQDLALDAMSKRLFAFINRRRDSVKVLYWERKGFVLRLKRLERKSFHWPRGHGQTLTLTGQGLNWLLDGFELLQWRPFARLHFTLVALRIAACKKCWTKAIDGTNHSAMSLPIQVLPPDDITSMKPIIALERMMNADAMSMRDAETERQR